MRKGRNGVLVPRFMGTLKLFLLWAALLAFFIWAFLQYPLEAFLAGILLASPSPEYLLLVPFYLLYYLGLLVFRGHYYRVTLNESGVTVDRLTGFKAIAWRDIERIECDQETRFLPETIDYELHYRDRPSDGVKRIKLHAGLLARWNSLRALRRYAAWFEAYARKARQAGAE